MEKIEIAIDKGRVVLDPADVPTAVYEFKHMKDEDICRCLVAKLVEEIGHLHLFEEPIAKKLRGE